METMSQKMRFGGRSESKFTGDIDKWTLAQRTWMFHKGRSIIIEAIKRARPDILDITAEDNGIDNSGQYHEGPVGRKLDYIWTITYTNGTTEKVLVDLGGFLCDGEGVSGVHSFTTKWYKYEECKEKESQGQRTILVYFNPYGIAIQEGKECKMISDNLPHRIGYFDFFNKDLLAISLDGFTFRLAVKEKVITYIPLDQDLRDVVLDPSNKNLYWPTDKI